MKYDQEKLKENMMVETIRDVNCASYSVDADEVGV